MNSRVNFKGLSELRALAALAVLFHHIELYKHRDNIYSLYDTKFESFISHLGKNGVYLFFVLSGFLITFLLLTEKERTGSIDIWKFYVRRALRIWPVYYLVVFLSFFLLPFLAHNIPALHGEEYYYNRILLLDNHFYSTLILFLLFLPNLALLLRPGVTGVAQAWSVGVEEQFYLFWPHLVKRVSNKHLPYYLLGIIILLTFFKASSIGEEQKYILFMKKFLRLFLIEFMAIGALGAYALYYYGNKLRPFFTNGWILFVTFAAVCLCLIKHIDNLALSCLFALLILFIVQDKSGFKLENKFLAKTGIWSYGIYMYHPIVMFFSFAFVNNLGVIKGSIIYNFLIYSLVLSITIVLSYLSYAYFERFFIKLKDKKYSVVESGPKYADKQGQN
ncbi:acyltransferase family protein [Rufibacter roseus]|uniref:Acyltransferase family protein n=1 Tax=Rufibacter roseus TaxID=1567108 RepID=A0ABW2DQT6_9BACT|nr:acyltransferase [Rufibacter roseus]